MRFKPASKPLNAPGCWCVEDTTTPMWEGVKVGCGYDQNYHDPKCCGCARNPRTEVDTQRQAEREHLLPAAEPTAESWAKRWGL